MARDYSDFFNCAVEPELALKNGKDLTDRVGDDESLIDAIDFVSPGIEVYNYRFWFGDPNVVDMGSTDAFCWPQSLPTVKR